MKDVYYYCFRIAIVSYYRKSVGSINGASFGSKSGSSGRPRYHPRPPKKLKDSSVKPIVLPDLDLCTIVNPPDVTKFETIKTG
jgi:hypothetical protein